jgi:hypothetical protein
MRFICYLEWKRNCNRTRWIPWKDTAAPFRHSSCARFEPLA